MDREGMVFKSVFVDPEVDRAVFAYARRVRTTKASVYRLFVDAGLTQLAAGASLPPARNVVSIMRTVDLSIDVDESLRILAFDLRIDWSQLVQRLTQLGMHSIETATSASSARKSRKQ